MGVKTYKDLGEHQSPNGYALTWSLLYQDGMNYLNIGPMIQLSDNVTWSFVMKWVIQRLFLQSVLFLLSI